MRRTLPVALFVFAALGAPAARAYDVATSSTGAPLHWAPGTVTFSLALDPSPAAAPASAVAPIVATSAATWQAVLGADGIDLAVSATPVAAAPHMADGVNSVRWIVDKADPDREAGLLGRTFVGYVASSGELRDADVVLDAADFAWTTNPATCGNEYDVQSALTHELGHAVGLAHAVGHPEATMFATGDACETTKRDLAPDDVSGIAKLYAAPPASGGCSTSGAASGADACVILGALVALRRRRRATAAAAAIAVSLAVPAAAAQLRRIGPAELARDAAMIVRGHVVATRALRAPGLETEATVVVDECLAGACPAELAVRRHGGELDDEGLWVDGEAALARGDEVLLYVRVDAAQHARVLGGVQGAWRIERAGAATLAVRDLRDHELATDHGWQHGAREVIDLDALRASLPPRAR